jgi:hypothetical protein
MSLAWRTPQRHKHLRGARKRWRAQEGGARFKTIVWRTGVDAEDLAQASEYGGSVILEFEGRAVVLGRYGAARTVRIRACVQLFPCVCVCVHACT